MKIGTVIEIGNEFYILYSNNYRIFFGSCSPFRDVLLLFLCIYCYYAYHKKEMGGRESDIAPSKVNKVAYWLDKEEKM